MPFVLIVVAIISSLVLGKEVKDFVQHPSVLPNSTVAPTPYVTPSFTPNPTPTPEPISTPSLYNQTQNTTQTRQLEQPAQQQTQGTTINCTGPDGKHLQVSKEQCDSFNAAWGKTQQTQQTSPTYSQPSYDYALPTYSPSFTPYQDNRIACQTSTGVYLLDPDTCKQTQAEDQQTQLKNAALRLQTQEYASKLYQDCVDQANAIRNQCNHPVPSGMTYAPCDQNWAEQQYQTAVSYCNQYPH